MLRQRKGLQIADAVHVTIPLPWLLAQLLDTPELQRLRGLHQLGVVPLVFPSADHTRFSHSLGVAHLAGRLGTALSLAQPELGISPVDVLCLQVAGLCHDLGHGPFSHTFERFRFAETGECWAHEAASVAMLQRLLSRKRVKAALVECGLTETDVTFVKELIQRPEVGTELGRPAAKAFLYDVVSNAGSGFDVDKYDYFLRDAAATGVAVAFSAASVDRLFASARVCAPPGGGRPLIAYEAKIITELRNVGLNRKHKTVLAYELLILRTLSKAHQAGFTFEDANGKLSNLVDAAHNMDALVQLKDSVVDLIANERLGNYPDPQKRQLIAEAAEIVRVQIPNRRHPKLVLNIPSNIPTSYAAGCNDEILRDLSKSRKPSERFNPANFVAMVVETHTGMYDEEPLRSVLFYRTERDGSASTKWGNEMELESRACLRRGLLLYWAARTDVDDAEVAVAEALVTRLGRHKEVSLTPERCSSRLIRNATPPSSGESEPKIPRMRLAFPEPTAAI